MVNVVLDKVASFRIDDTVLQKVSNEAKQKQVSLNRMMNIILHDHITLGADVLRSGFISIRRSVLINLLEGVTDKKMIEIARHVVEVEGKEILLSLKNEFDDISIFDWLENWIKISGYQYKHDIINSEAHYYLVYHNIGYNWSVYLTHVWGMIFKKMLKIEVEFELTDHSLSFRIDSTKKHKKRP